MAPDSRELFFGSRKVLSKTSLFSINPVTLINISILIQILTPAMSLPFQKLSLIDFAISIKELPNTIMIALPLTFDFLSSGKNISPKAFSIAVFILADEMVTGFVMDAAATLGEVVGPLAFEDVAVVENDNTATVFEAMFPMAFE